MTRKSFAGVLPPIVVWNPAIGSHLADAVRVTGTANVFEASLHVRIVNQQGVVIARANVLASCGTGCRGGYSGRRKQRGDSSNGRAERGFRSGESDPATTLPGPARKRSRYKARSVWAAVLLRLPGVTRREYNGSRQGHRRHRGIHAGGH
jgi:hypothetical protein